MSENATLGQTAEPVGTPVRVSLPASVPYVTYSIIGLTVLVYLLQLASVALYPNVAGPACARSVAGGDLLELFGARINACIRAGELWRFLTPVLLHGSMPHILFNMYALWAFGAGLERHFGHGRFLTLYVLGGFTGNVLSFVLSDGYSVGASTAIFGLVAAEGMFLYQNRGLFGRQFGRAIGNVVFVVAVNLVLGLSPGIDNWGHVGGLLGGLVFTWFAGPTWELQQTGAGLGGNPALVLVDRREPREVVIGAATVLLIFGALAVWGLLLR
ncbi:MAG TPA: rhomboid family intramembrane serine protease [Anaerolineales bacterium]